MKRWKGILLIVWHMLIVQPLRRLRDRGRGLSGRARFVENYRADGLFPLDASERAALPRFSRCIHCGLCDAVCPALGTVSRRIFPGPSALAIATSRNLPALPYAREAADIYAACADCGRCEAVCPTQVPLLEIARFVARH